MDEGVKRFWKSIWHLKVPSKVKIFLWRACSSALPTKVGYTKERLLIIKFVISVCWKLRMKFVQSGVVTISK